MTNAELRALVIDTAAVWDAGLVVAQQGDAVRVTAMDGRSAMLRRGGPLRWMLQTEGGRTRPCASIVALLDALRSAVGPRDAAPTLRVVSPDG